MGTRRIINVVVVSVIIDLVFTKVNVVMEMFVAAAAAAAAAAATASPPTVTNNTATAAAAAAAAAAVTAPLVGLHHLPTSKGVHVLSTTSHFNGRTVGSPPARFSSVTSTSFLPPSCLARLSLPKVARVKKGDDNTPVVRNGPSLVMVMCMFLIILFPGFGFFPQ
jgi:hypothetical protein